MEIDDINFAKFRCWFEADRVIKLAELSQKDFDIVVQVLKELDLISFTETSHQAICWTAVELHQKHWKQFVTITAIVAINFLSGYLSIISGNSWYWTSVGVILFLATFNLLIHWANTVKLIERQLTSDGQKRRASINQAKVRAQVQAINNQMNTVNSQIQKMTNRINNTVNHANRIYNKLSAY